MKGPDGKELFRNIQVGLACEACKAAGTADTCEHNQDEIPPWKSREKFDMVKALYGDRKDLLMRESMGIVTEDQTSLYRQDWVDSFVANIIAIAKPVPRFILVACDPNGGGDSNMAIVSATFCTGTMVIVGIDYHAVRGHDEIQVLLMAHVAELQRVYPDTWLIFVGESNLGQEADHMKHMLRDETNVYAIMEGGLAGVRTTQKRKELYAMELCKFISQKALAHTGDALVATNPLKKKNHGGPAQRHHERAQKAAAGLPQNCSSQPDRALRAANLVHRQVTGRARRHRGDADDCSLLGGAVHDPAHPIGAVRQF